MTTVLVIDAANVIGARADGWWKDRVGAAVRLLDEVLVADVPHDRVIVVLEGAAKGAATPGKAAHVQIVHAARDGDSAIVAQARRAADQGHRVTVVTADRALAANVSAVADIRGPQWLIDRL
ncbi:MAG: hypothetical protein ACSLEW_02815 [Nocardioides sp.]